MKLTQLVTGIILCILSGCGIINPKADHANLGDSIWTLIAINQTPVKLQNASIKFDEKESKIKGAAACNSFGASYEMLKNAIKFESLITTKKYCEGLMDEENQIITNLQNIDRYEVKANVLYFYSSDQLLLTYKR